MAECKINDCNGKILAKGYCRKHYLQIYRHGKVLERTIYDPNEITVKDDTAEVVLYNIKGLECARTTIDIDSIKKIKRHKWYLSGTGYAETHINGNTVRMQHIIMGVEVNKKRIVDHKDRDKLNNRKSNYRVCSFAKNLLNSGMKKNNTSGYKGVFKEGKKWQARIGVDGENIRLGLFKDKREAAKAYNAGAIKHHGEFAYSNQT